MSEEHIVRHRLGDKIEGSRTDWARLKAMTEEEIEANALSDPDAQPLSDEFLKNAKRITHIEVPVEMEVLEWFKGQGEDDYTVHMMKALRTYMESQVATKAD